MSATAARCVALFQELAYSRALHILESDLIPNTEVTIAGVCMALAEALRDEGVGEDSLALDYDQFCTYGEQCIASKGTGDGEVATDDEVTGELFRQYFSATVFVQLANPEDEKVGLGVLQDYMTQHQRYLRAVVLLSRIDLERSGGNGRLTEDVVEEFVASYLEHRHHHGPLPYVHRLCCGCGCGE